MNFDTCIKQLYWAICSQRVLHVIYKLNSFLDSFEIAQLEERKDFDLKIVGSIPLCFTFFLPQGHRCSLTGVVFTVGDPESKWLKR